MIYQLNLFFPNGSQHIRANSPIPIPRAGEYVKYNDGTLFPILYAVRYVNYLYSEKQIIIDVHFH